MRWCFRTWLDHIWSWIVQDRVKTKKKRKSSKIGWFSYKTKSNCLRVVLRDLGGGLLLIWRKKVAKNLQVTQPRLCHICTFWTSDFTNMFGMLCMACVWILVSIELHLIIENSKSRFFITSSLSVSVWWFYLTCQFVNTLYRSHKTHSPHQNHKFVPGFSLVTQPRLCHFEALDTFEVGIVISKVCTPSRTSLV